MNVYVDGAYIKDGRYGTALVKGNGITIEDERQWFGTNCKSSMEAEYKAVINALICCKASKCEKVTINSDCLSVVRFISKEKPLDGAKDIHRKYTEQIWELIKEFDGFYIHHIKSKENLAHVGAKEAAYLQDYVRYTDYEIEEAFNYRKTLLVRDILDIIGFKCNDRTAKTIIRRDFEAIRNKDHVIFCKVASDLIELLELSMFRNISNNTLNSIIGDVKNSDKLKLWIKEVHRVMREHRGILKLYDTAVLECEDKEVVNFLMERSI